MTGKKDSPQMGQDTGQGDGQDLSKLQQSQELIDTYGRVHRDLRISVTDKCNFRCVYCMPEEGLEWLSREELLSFEEIYRVAELCVNRFGVDAIRLTGGEPTLRTQLPKLVEMLASLNIDLAITTNGLKLPSMAKSLKSAGLNRINISLDSLKRDRFEELTRRDELDRVLEGIAAAKDAGFDIIKINTVVMRGINDDELLDFAKFGRDNGYEVRFIEFMPLDADEIWSKDKVFSLEEILETISKVYPVADTKPAQNSDPASGFHYADGKGRFGVIASVTQSFCHLCDRVRLTSDGQFRNCLFSTQEYDLRAILRSKDLSEEERSEEMAEIITTAVHNKWAGHNINEVYFIRPSRSMSQIGG